MFAVIPFGETFSKKYETKFIIPKFLIHENPLHPIKNISF